jgi:hypothetical protein
MCTEVTGRRQLLITLHMLPTSSASAHVAHKLGKPHPSLHEPNTKRGAPQPVATTDSGVAMHGAARARSSSGAGLAGAFGLTNQLGEHLALLVLPSG